MHKAMFVLGILLLLAVLAWWLRGRRLRASTFDGLPGEERVAMARKARLDALRWRCRGTGIAYPPREIFLRAFKQEGLLEVWARGDAGPLKLLTSYPVLAASGVPGPKRKEGDRQVPEGFYVIERFNPNSSYHLSLGLDYPNQSDRILGDPKAPGSDIFIHGKNVTIGCLPIGDRAIEELFVLALDARLNGQRDIAVHIFPARMHGDAWEKFRDQHARLRKFWDQLKPVFDQFERTRVVPAVAVGDAGEYRLEAGTGVIERAVPASR